MSLFMLFFTNYIYKVSLRSIYLQQKRYYNYKQKANITFRGDLCIQNIG